VEYLESKYFQLRKNNNENRLLTEELINLAETEEVFLTNGRLSLEDI